VPPIDEGRTVHAALEPKAIPGIGIVIPAVDDPLKFREFVNLRVAVVVAPFAVESSSSEALATDSQCTTMSKAKMANAAATFMIVANFATPRSLVI
jgi:hypothetical protein